MFDKIEIFSKRYDELNNRLYDPTVASDATKFNEIMKELNQPIAIPLESVRGYYRYFTHKDNPEKFQYDDKKIELYNGFDVTDVLNNFEVFQSLKQIQLLIIEQDIIEYSDLLDYLMKNDYMEMWNVACSHTLFLNSYITSKRHKREKEIEKEQKRRELDKEKES